VASIYISIKEKVGIFIKKRPGKRNFSKEQAKRSGDLAEESKDSGGRKKQGFKETKSRVE